MKNYLVLCLTLTLIACGPSQKDRDIAAVTCAVMGETRIMDAAIRVREMNEARKKIGGEPFLRGDNAIKEAFEYGLCEELVLNVAYDESLKNLIDAKRERERIAAEKRAEEIRIAAEKRAEEERIAAEKKAEEQRIAAEKQRIANSTPTVKEEFYSNGELKKRRNYQSKDDGGKQHGLYRWWRENGQLREETAYENGEKH